MCVSKLLATVFLTAACGGIALAQAPPYGPVSFVGSGVGPTALAKADIDGDGDLDIIAAVAGPSLLTIYLNDGLGNLSTGASLGTANGPTDVIAADFDGDGDIDLAALAALANQVTVFMNLGSGVFNVGLNYPAGIGPFRMAAGDIDVDGDLDIVVANPAINGASILRNDGFGNFTFLGSATGVPDAADIAFGDFDGDGDSDVVVVSPAMSAVMVLRNEGNSFTPMGFKPVGAAPLSVVVADVNSNLKLDIITANVGGSSITVLSGNGNFGFTRQDFPTLGTPVDLIATNADNALGTDIAVVSFNDYQVAVMTNNGAGQFAVAYTSCLGANPFAMASADLDGDFDDELVVANFSSDDVAVVPSLLPSLAYPGTGDDLIAGAGVNANAVLGAVNYRQTASSGDFVQIGMVSPGGAYDNRHALLALQVFYADFPPISPAPGIHVNNFGFGALLLIDSPALNPVGETFSFILPTGVAGLRLMNQAIALDGPASQNGIYGTSPGYEILLID